MDFIEDQLSKIAEIFQHEKLISLSDNEYNYKGLNVLGFSSFNPINGRFIKFSPSKNITDIVNCNNDLKLLTANLFIYRSFINDPNYENGYFEGTKTFINHQNGADWVYSTYVSCCYEKLYNFWDRIGDSLAYYLDIEIEENLVNFTKVIDKMAISKLYDSNPYFQFLKSFKENEFSEFNKHRKDIVHYYQFETTYFHEFHSNSQNEKKIMELWEWKRNMPEYFKNHLIQSCDGFYNTYKLIKDTKAIFR